MTAYLRVRSNGSRRVPGRFASVMGHGPVRLGRAGRRDVRWAVLLAWFLCTFPSVAGAAGSRAVMVLNVAEEGRPQEGLRLHIADLLQRAGATLVEAPKPRSPDRSCAESRCLTKLAEAYRVDLILAADIGHHAGRDRLINIWLYDARTGHDQSESELCDVRDIEERMRALAGRLIGPLLQDATRKDRKSVV